MIVDESHVTIPQASGMYRGDRSRKETLVEYGFRLPCALDNRPLKFTEFEEMLDRVVYVSATLGPYELEHTRGRVAEQIVRPTGLLDPEITVKPARNQVDDLVGELRKTVADGDRVLVTTLTKRFSEELSEYLEDLGVRVKYLHSDIDTLERTAILRDLRLGSSTYWWESTSCARARPPRGGARRGARRRQGGILAFGHGARPDLRPRGAQHPRPGHPLRRRDDRLDEQGDQRDAPPPRDPGGIQQKARHHPREHSQGGARPPHDRRPRLRRRPRRAGGAASGKKGGKKGPPRTPRKPLSTARRSPSRSPACAPRWPKRRPRCASRRRLASATRSSASKRKNCGNERGRGAHSQTPTKGRRVVDELDRAVGGGDRHGHHPAPDLRSRSIVGMWRSTGRPSAARHPAS